MTNDKLISIQTGDREVLIEDINDSVLVRKTGDPSARIISGDSDVFSNIMGLI